MENLDDLALRLRNAQQHKVAISPIREQLGTEDLDSAYKIQRINARNNEKQGFRQIGKKIGLTSLVVQKQLGVDQPDYGVLFDNMQLLTGHSVRMDMFIQAKAEAEVALVLGKDLNMPSITIVDLINAVDYVLPAIEIVDSRIRDWDIRITDTIADNASSSHFVLGHQPKKLHQFDIVNCKMELKVNGEVQSSGVGHNCLGSPLNAALWLANKMYENGQPLQAGELLLTGALGPMITLNTGQDIYGHIEGLGEIRLKVE